MSPVFYFGIAQLCSGRASYTSRNMSNNDDNDHLQTPLIAQKTIATKEEVTDDFLLSDEEIATNATVASEEDYRENDSNSTTSTTSTTESCPFQRVYKVFHTPLLPDHEISIRYYPLLEGSASIKMIKFLALTLISIAAVHALVADHKNLFFTNDRDHALTWHRLWTYDGNLVVMDTIVFFLVGRLWKDTRVGVDHLAFCVPVVLCNLYFECQEYLPFLQHSVTLYEMKCTWPMFLWIFVLCGLIPVVLGLVAGHVYRAYGAGLLLVKLVEVSLAALLFTQPLVSPVSSPKYVHVHHWFAGWMLGMHCNYDAWWSRLAMAWCWGMYINGVAVYGRAPVLGCEYARFLMEDDRCGAGGDEMMLLGMVDSGENAVPDWRNCAID